VEYSPDRTAEPYGDIGFQDQTGTSESPGRAHSWYASVLEGNALDQRALARHAGLTERYVGKVFRCAFLAPDIVESILEGRQPDDLTFARLCTDIPLSWTEQRRQFGFPPIPAR